jgi:hypothetical protein
VGAHAATLADTHCDLAVGYGWAVAALAARVVDIDVSTGTKLVVLIQARAIGCTFGCQLVTTQLRARGCTGIRLGVALAWQQEVRRGLAAHCRAVTYIVVSVVSSLMHTRCMCGLSNGEAREATIGAQRDAGPAWY